MNQLAPIIHDSQNGLDYRLNGDYYIPIMTPPDTGDPRPIGRWGRLHRDYLKEHRPAIYGQLLLTCQLHTMLADLNTQAEHRLHLMIDQLVEAEGVTEQLKAQNPLVWVAHMNAIRAQAEEIILQEMIYC